MHPRIGTARHVIVPAIAGPRVSAGPWVQQTNHRKRSGSYSVLQKTDSGRLRKQHPPW
jgi:hypothetical protein